MAEEIKMCELFEEIFYKCNKHLLNEKTINVKSAAEGYQVAKLVKLDPMKPLSREGRFDTSSLDTKKLNSLPTQKINNLAHLQDLKKFGEFYGVDLVRPTLQLKAKGLNFFVLPATSNGDSGVFDCQNKSQEIQKGYSAFGRWGISSSGTPWVAGQEGGHKPGTKYGGYWAVKNGSLFIRGRSIESDEFVLKQVPWIVGQLCGDRRSGSPTGVPLI